LLHGWLQCLDDLIEFGQRLRDARGTDVLLLDFYAHGRSPCLPAVRMHTVLALVAQLRRVVQIIGWQGRQLVLGGMSMGVSVALHYARWYPDDVCGLLLIAPSGMQEGMIHLTHAARKASKRLIGKEDLPPELRPGSTVVQFALTGDHEASRKRGALSRAVRRVLAKLNFVKWTPRYRVGEEEWAAVFDRRWPTTVVVGRYDFIHNPHVADWRRRAPHARIVISPATHWWLCKNAHELELERDPLWMSLSLDNCQPKLSPEPSAGMSHASMWSRL